MWNATPTQLPGEQKQHSTFPMNSDGISIKKLPRTKFLLKKPPTKLILLEINLKQN